MASSDPQSPDADSSSLVPLDGPFSGFVFKIQANMDPRHRDRIAFLRICSGQVLAASMSVTHSAHREARAL